MVAIDPINKDGLPSPVPDQVAPKIVDRTTGTRKNIIKARPRISRNNGVTDVQSATYNIYGSVVEARMVGDRDVLQRRRSEPAVDRSAVASCIRRIIAECGIRNCQGTAVDNCTTIITDCRISYEQRVRDCAISRVPIENRAAIVCCRVSIKRCSINGQRRSIVNRTAVPKAAGRVVFKPRAKNGECTIAFYSTTIAVSAHRITVKKDVFNRQLRIKTNVDGSTGIC